MPTTTALDMSVLSRRALLRGSALLAGGAALSGLPFGQMLRAHSVDESWPHVAALANRYLSERKVANLLMTFGWGQEDMAHTVGGGTLSLARPAPVDMDSLFRIYSMSKPITGMATMILIDEGKLGLDQPLGDILPAFRQMQVLVDPAGSLDDTVPANQPITIRQLLTHTSGLGYQIISKGPLQQAYNELGLVGGRVSRMPIPGFPKVTPAPGLAVWADRLATLPLMYQPATKWSYSCSIDLLGRVIEVASGMEFEAFLKARIFDPCGMTSTWFQVPSSEAHRLTDNYGIVGGNPFPLDPGPSSIYTDPPEVPAGGGGLVSSPKDYDRFLRMLLGYGRIDGKFVMSEEAVRVGTSNLLPASVDTSGSWIAGEGHGAGGRSTGSTFGWGGAAGTLAAVDFDLGLRTGLFTQYMPAEAYPIRDEFLAAIDADLKALRDKKKAA
ncbi:serine hydrolase domain-containing protein [Porphyrobacter sp. LM 6]|uniref:serine hydrolase domain-containing protein n=1 Tax=Porphyrobacter sp. LM 6 TaxID=1896196 RepID=UPI0008639435|nr:serine hydrolase domain-containing protein [Porphyrobacter sp. LM 6]AOL95293.1 CubicO group peptidase, beta-lactamase class C family [Porphyrobacter sp. LM 6]